MDTHDAEESTGALAERVRDAYRDGHTLALMESCTGGLVASALTDISGSGYLAASAVCYHPSAKTALGVPGEVIERHGVVSAEVAAAMAECAARFFGVEYGLSTTGVAGPGSDDDGVPPGTVWLALRLPSGETITRKLCLDGDREKVKRDAVHAACRLLLAYPPRPELPGCTKRDRG